MITRRLLKHCPDGAGHALHPHLARRSSEKNAAEPADVRERPNRRLRPSTTRRQAVSTSQTRTCNQPGRKTAN
jgi:hypothetical protein